MDHILEHHPYSNRMNPNTSLEGTANPLKYTPVIPEKVGLGR